VVTSYSCFIHHLKHNDVIAFDDVTTRDAFIVSVFIFIKTCFYCFIICIYSFCLGGAGVKLYAMVISE